MPPMPSSVRAAALALALAILGLLILSVLGLVLNGVVAQVRRRVLFSDPSQKLELAQTPKKGGSL